MKLHILVSGSGLVGLSSVSVAFVAIGKKSESEQIASRDRVSFTRLGKKGSFGKVRRLIEKKKDIRTHNGQRVCKGAQSEGQQLW